MQLHTLLVACLSFAFLSLASGISEPVQSRMTVDVEPTTGTVLKLDLHNLEAEASCFCKFSKRPSLMRNSQCRLPHRIDVVAEKAGRRDIPALSSATMKWLLGSVNQVRLATVEHSSFACCDGRQVDTSSPRAFGGDFGEFLNMLSLVDKNEGYKLTQEIVDSLFYDWIDVPKSRGKHEMFYYHTDLSALSKLTWYLKKKHDWRGESLIDLTNVPEALQEDVLAALAIPDHHGCIHLRLALSFPQRYGTSVRIFGMLVRSYFSTMWDKQRRGKDGKTLLYTRIRYVVSQGGHRERAFFSVNETPQCQSERVVPVVTLSRRNDIGMESSRTDINPYTKGDPVYPFGENPYPSRVQPAALDKDVWNKKDARLKEETERAQLAALRAGRRTRRDYPLPSIDPKATERNNTHKHKHKNKRIHTHTPSPSFLAVEEFFSLFEGADAEHTLDRPGELLPYRSTYRPARGMQVWTYYPGAVKNLREQLAEFAGSRRGDVSSKRARFLLKQAMIAQGEKADLQTKEAIATELPEYSVFIS